MLTSAPAPTSPRGDLDRLYAPTDGRSGADLIAALHVITKSGHRDRGYGSATEELFSRVADLDGDDRVADMFTGEVRGPIAGRDDGRRHGMNTEHTWPQSKGARGIAKSDLHHLQASDIATNGRRGNDPYGEVARIKWKVGEGAQQAALGVDLLGKTVFEPGDSMKGDVARGLLYFYTRYAAAPTSDFALDNFRHELPTLLKWNAQDPVDDNERARNDAIQAYQGNRNPFIDRPEFVERADFTHLSLGGRKR